MFFYVYKCFLFYIQNKYKSKNIFLFASLTTLFYQYSIFILKIMSNFMTTGHKFFKIFPLKYVSLAWALNRIMEISPLF